ncbi:MAG: hypothetical protein COW88_03120 [Candidatus Lloydbacteria bacterium CG22_combo_CG10-13_8_21_14_all_47_15]|uniref:Uncharacterized protein n=1 Tax=Candidatus Lloydbacteria bacterium CG22_combo_CG10-13_8_21_14_all_47_15 TaxID=1974635 RepID=A0A2H0CT24_9BACT|nr:MAG: hypothetical protein COW88_03120 [Candidatus Lloydbacteria bacterium CG22_combo_CG10-13_8_21_14_all_47_15]
MEQEVKKLPKKYAGWLKWLLIVGTVIVLNLFFNSAIKVAYHEPEYTDFCEEKQVRVIPETKDECLEVGGQWTEDRFVQYGLLEREPVPVPKIATEKEGYCDPDFTCRQGYEDARDVYERNVFVAWTIAGVIAIIVAIFVPIETLSLSLSLGGVVSLVIGSTRYWSRMDDVLRLVVLGIALVALIWVGIKKIRE